MAKCTVIRYETPAVDPVPEYKVEGKPYAAAKEGKMADPGEVLISMTVDEARKIQAMLYGGVCSVGGISPPTDVWVAIERVLGRGIYKMKQDKSSKGDLVAFSWPYLVNRDVR